MRLLLTILLFISVQSFGQHYPIGNMMGVNCYSWDVIGHWTAAPTITQRKQQAFKDLNITRIRLSTDAFSNKDDSNKLYRFSPNTEGFQMDSGIILLKKLIPGIIVDLCYQNQPKNIHQEYVDAKILSTAYVHLNADLNLPSSYSELAHDCAVLAARGGLNANTPDYPLYHSPNWWDPSQTMYKGAHLYDIIEPQNELDNEYSNTDPLNGAQYAALWSAVYDSVKKIDPSILVSTTGIANGVTSTLTDAIAWSNKNRSTRPFDIAQHHSYPWSWYLGTTGGLPTEKSIIREVKPLVAAAQGTPLSVGEWNWDTNPASPINAPIIPGYTNEQSAGNQIVRTILKFSQIGVHDAYLYRLFPDYYPNIDSSGGVFATSYLAKQIDDSNHIQISVRGYYFSQMATFKDYSFADSIRDDSICVLHFTAPGKPDMYAFWTVEQESKYVDAKGITRLHFKETFFSYYGFNKTGTRYDLSDSSTTMIAKSYSGGALNLSSKPFFIVVDNSIPKVPTVVKEYTITIPFILQLMSNGSIRRKQ